MLIILPFAPVHKDYALLLDESLTQGQRMLQRLLANWQSGKNRFDERGEMLVASFVGGQLAGVCGRNIDPYGLDNVLGRVRHLYVAQSFRGQGIGTALVRHIMSDAAQYFNRLNTRSPESAYGFYEHLGFERVTGQETVTHSYVLTAQKTEAP